MYALLLVASWPLGAHAQTDDGNIDAGREVALHGALSGHAGCAACHMQNGAGQPETAIPRLAGLHETYIGKQLLYFSNGGRQSPIMEPYARMLTPRQRTDVAAYYASLPLPAPLDPEPVAPAQLALGQQIAEHGRAGLPACSGCHGPTEMGLGDFSPPIGGQSAAYIVKQLRTWHGGQPRDPGGAAMSMEAHSMTPVEIEAVAAYLSTVPGAPHPSAGAGGSK